MTRLQLSEILIAKREFDEATATLEQTLEEFTSMGDRVGITRCRQHLRDLRATSGLSCAHAGS